MKDTCAAWGLYQLTYGEGVAWHGRPCICLHLIMLYWTKPSCLQRPRRSDASCTVRELQPRELVDWVNQSSQNGEVVCVRVCAVRNPGRRLASFNPDKLIGSRRREGTPWPPYTLVQGEVGVGCPPKNTAADATKVTAINQNHLGMRCTS